MKLSNSALKMGGKTPCFSGFSRLQILGKLTKSTFVSALELWRFAKAVPYMYMVAIGGSFGLAHGHQKLH
jgi:hypothetical protein